MKNFFIVFEGIDGSGKGTMLKKVHNFLFEKKEGIFRYGKKVSFYFWQGEREVVFLTKHGKKKFELPQESIKIVKTQDGYEIIKNFPVKTFTLPVEFGTVYLKVRK